MIEWADRIKEACRILREDGSGMVLLNGLVPVEGHKVVNLGVEPLVESGLIGKKRLGKYLWELRNERAVRRSQENPTHPLVLWVYYDDEADTSHIGMAHVVSPEVAEKWAALNAELEVV